MIAVTTLVILASLWLLWEWKSGALSPSAPAEPAVGRRAAPPSKRSIRRLPTSAALNADLLVAARTPPSAHALNRPSGG